MRLRLREDTGVSLIEMVVAVGVLGVLMALVSAFFLNAYGGIRDASGLSQVQQEQRNAILRMTTALRYADNSAEGSSPGTAFVAAGDDSVAFYSRSRMAANQTSPSLVTISVTTAPPNPGLVISTLAPGAAQASSTVAVRTEPGHTPRVAFTYLNAEGQTITAAQRALAGWERDLHSVRVRIVDVPSGLGVDETVVLVNPL